LDEVFEVAAIFPDFNGSHHTSSSKLRARATLMLRTAQRSGRARHCRPPCGLRENARARAARPFPLTAPGCAAAQALAAAAEAAVGSQARGRRRAARG